MTTRILTEAERSILTNALCVSAEVYRTHAKAIAELAAEGEPVNTRLGAQFEKQATEANALAEIISDAEMVTIGGTPV